MSKEKSKSRGLETRRLLTVTLCLMILICAATVIRFVLYHVSKDSQHYQLTGDSYLSSWSQEKQLTNNVMSVRYTKVASGQGLMANITFTHFDRGYLADQMYKQISSNWIDPVWKAPYYRYVTIDFLSTNKFTTGCTDLVWGGRSCIFGAQYGTCVIKVESPIIEPHITANDYKQLIENYIDPQMAAWDVCYGA